MWWGMASGTWALRQRPQWFKPAPGGDRGPAIRGLAWLGRWSLSYYMLHQPVLIGLLMAVGALAWQAMDMAHKKARTGRAFDLKGGAR
jgi:peptidoglycan/LPS O-acetylase OafA/YrhL